MSGLPCHRGFDKINPFIQSGPYHFNDEFCFFFRDGIEARKISL